MGLSPVAVTYTSDFVPALSKEFLDIQATIECGFTLKRICDMTRTYSQWQSIFKILLLLLLQQNFVSGSNLELMYLSLIVNIRSNLVHLLDFQLLVLLQQPIEILFYSVPTGSIFRINQQPSNHCKWVLEAVNWAHANEVKESIILCKLGSSDFQQIDNSVLNKDESAMSPLFIGSEVLS